MRWIWLVVALGSLSCSKPSDPAPKPEDRHEPPAAVSKLTLTITIAGKAGTAWHDDVFAATPKLAGAASDGEARDTWSLRELAHTNLGPTARVTAVTSALGTQAIDAAAWSDASKVPILHTTKRGTLKFRWADATGKWGETVLKDVTGLELVP